MKEKQVSAYSAPASLEDDKIYCKNCIHYNSGWALCFALLNKYSQMPRRTIYKSENRTGQCKYYKKQWYKFWIE